MKQQLNAYAGSREHARLGSWIHFFTISCFGTCNMNRVVPH